MRTFAAIEREALDWARTLAGIAPGAVVAIQIGNSPSWPALFLALMRAGLIALPLGQHMEASELARVFETCRVGALVLPGGKVEPLAPTSPNVWSGVAPDLLKLTSGTTAAPRVIRFRAGQLLADCLNICQTMGLSQEDLNFGVIPFSHSYGFSNLITPLLACGVPLVASEERIPRAVLNDLARSGATVFPGMPIFYQKFVDMESAPVLPRLRLCISAGAPLPKLMAQRFTEQFGQKIHTFYGASECGGIAYDASASADYVEGFVGRALAGVSIEGPAGEGASPISVRSAAVGDGYYPGDEALVLGAGRFVPADVLSSSDAGLCIEGRASDVINIAGRKLNPVEIEQRVLECPGVTQVVVFGVPSALRGEEPIACVTTEPGGDRAVILRFCNANLSSWQRPKDVWLLHEIPTNERGKVSRKALAQQYLARASN